MAKIKGTNAVLQVATTDTATAYNTVAHITEFSHPLSADNEETQSFGDTWKERLQTLKDFSVSASGFFDNTDTNGQIAIRNALVNDTTLYYKVLYDGTNGYSQECKVSSFEIAPSVDNIVPLDFELEGTGTPTAI